LARFLAIDADAHGLFVATATLKSGGGIAIEQVLAVTEEAAPLSAANAVDLGTRLKAQLREAGIKPAPVLLCVGRDRIIPKLVRHPPTLPAEEPAIVRFQALRELTENPDDVAMDYTPVGEPTAGERQALAVFVRKQVVQSARQFCEAAGLKLAAVTPRPFAAVAAARHAFATGAAPAPDDPSGPIAVVTLGDRGGEFTIGRGGDLPFSRTIPMHAVAVEPALIAELKRNLAVYAGQNPAAPVEAVYLAEPDEPGSGWAGRVRAALHLPVYAFDPLAGSAAAESVPVGLRGRLAGPVGLLAARAASASLPINFVQTRQPRAEPGKARPRILLAALAAVLFLAMGGVFAFLQIERAGRAVRERMAIRDDLDTRLKLVDADRKRLEAVDELAARQVVVLDELHDLTDRIPDVGKVKVTEFDLAALPPPKKETRAGVATPPARRNAPAPPVATLKVALRSSDPAAAQRVYDALRNDRYYVGATRTTGGTSAGDRGQSVILVAQVLHRKPGEYTRELDVQAPVIEDQGNEITGGFEP
jgi:Tfp pilus assembly PilM family ATPase